MDGKVIHSLFTLLYQRVAEYLPSQVFGLAIHLFKSLIHRYGAHRYRTVAQYPLSGFVDIGSSRKVHQRIAAPFTAPYGLFHLLFNTGILVRVAYVGVYLDQEIGTDNHGFCLWMIDIGRNHGTPSGHLTAHKLRSDVCVNTQFCTVHVLSDGNILHFLCNDAPLGKCHLGVSRLSRVYPWLSRFGQSFLQIYIHRRVTVGSAGVVHIDRRILCHYLLSFLYHHGGCKVHAAHAYSQLWIDGARHIYLL